jgi:hypothetical protein
MNVKEVEEIKQPNFLGKMLNKEIHKLSESLRPAVNQSDYVENSGPKFLASLL